MLYVDDISPWHIMMMCRHDLCPWCIAAIYHDERSSWDIVTIYDYGMPSWYCIIVFHHDTQCLHIHMINHNDIIMIYDHVTRSSNVCLPPRRNEKKQYPLPPSEAGAKTLTHYRGLFHGPLPNLITVQFSSILYGAYSQWLQLEYKK